MTSALSYLTESEQSLLLSVSLPESYLVMDLPGTVSGSDNIPEVPEASVDCLQAMAANSEPVLGENSSFIGFDLVMFLSIYVYSLLCGFGLSLVLNLLGWVIGQVKLLIQKGGG